MPARPRPPVKIDDRALMPGALIAFARDGRTGVGMKIRTLMLGREVTSVAQLWIAGSCEPPQRLARQAQVPTYVTKLTNAQIVPSDDASDVQYLTRGETCPPFGAIVVCTDGRFMVLAHPGEREALLLDLASGQGLPLRLFEGGQWIASWRIVMRSLDHHRPQTLCTFRAGRDVIGRGSVADP